jgi:GH18 family chitinase
MRIVCYYTNWSVYRQRNLPILYPDTIEPELCTHIHIAFALINPQTLKIEASEKHDTHYTDVFDMVD